MKLSKIVDIFAITLLLLLVVCAFMIMRGTTESNAITTEIVAHEAKKDKNKRVLIQMGLLTAEVKNLQKDMDSLLEEVKQLQKKLQVNERREP